MDKPYTDRQPVTSGDPAKSGTDSAVMKVDVLKLLERGYSTKGSTRVQETLCRRCYWAAKAVDGGRIKDSLDTQKERDKYAYTGRIKCLLNNPNHIRIRDCYCFMQAQDSMPLECVQGVQPCASNDSNKQGAK